MRQKALKTMGEAMVFGAFLYFEAFLYFVVGSNIMESNVEEEME